MENKNRVGVPIMCNEDQKEEVMNLVGYNQKVEDKDTNNVGKYKLKSSYYPELRLVTFEAVKRFKSVNRAYKRGHITINGIIMPKRPFNNKKNTCKRKGKHSRTINELKKKYYFDIKNSTRVLNM